MEANYFTILLWFLPYIDMNQPWVYMCFPSWPPPHLPPHPIPQGHPSAPVLSALFHALNLDWSSISRMIMYMFHCYSLKSSHPQLPQSPKFCPLHLCLFCCLAYRVIITIFLNSIYICLNILYWCFSFWLTSLHIIGSSFIHLIRTESDYFYICLLYIVQKEVFLCDLIFSFPYDWDQITGHWYEGVFGSFHSVPLFILFFN